MQEVELMETIAAIRARDPRYETEAYLFLREALDYTVKFYKKPASGAGRHVTAGELLEGFRLLALEEFGPMALTVLQTWGLQTTQDIGAIVFNLVEAGKLGKTEQDAPQDFSSGYDFAEAFAQPFQPRRARNRRHHGGFTRGRGTRRAPSAQPHTDKEDAHA